MPPGGGRSEEGRRGRCFWWGQLLPCREACVNVTPTCGALSGPPTSFHNQKDCGQQQAPRTELGQPCRRQGTQVPAPPLQGSP